MEAAPLITTWPKSGPIKSWFASRKPQNCEDARLERTIHVTRACHYCYPLFTLLAFPSPNAVKNETDYPCCA